jgi:hypothetical protein
MYIQTYIYIYTYTYIYICIYKFKYIHIGDDQHLKALLPHPKAAIFLSDYNKNYTKLAEHLNYLSHNETAYMEYRVWRKTFSFEKNSKNNALLKNSWYCNVCKWAYDNRKLRKMGKMAYCKD